MNDGAADEVALRRSLSTADDRPGLVKALLLAGHAAMTVAMTVANTNRVTTCGCAALKDELESNIERAEEEHRRRELALKQHIERLDASLECERADATRRIREDTEDAWRQARSAMADEIAMARQESHRVKETAREEVDRERAVSRQLVANMQNAETQRMREELAATRAALDRVMSSNHAKGIVGEDAVAAVLRRVFDDWNFTDTSGRGAMSDIHLTNTRGDVIAVEVKNKAVVTQSDVTKSVRDVRELLDGLGGRLIGYAFVSLRSRNIPGKGALSMECMHGVPVLWYGIEGGLEGDAAKDDLGRCAKLLECFANCAALDRQQHSGESSTAVVAMTQRLNNQLTTLETWRKTVAALNDTLSASRRHATSLSASLDVSFKDLEAFIKAETAATPSSFSSTAPTPLTDHPEACKICGCKYKTARGLAHHVKAKHDVSTNVT